MRRSVLVIAAALAVAACQDVSTAPDVADLNVSQDRRSNPPPPPIETEAFVSVGISTTLASASSISPQATCESANPPFFFIVPAKYLFNPVQNSGWVHFQNDDDADMTASANGMVRKHGDDVSGSGELTFIVGDGCELTIDLSSVSFALMGECDPPIIIGDAAPAAAPDDNPEQGCYQLHFDDVFLNGEEVPGGADVNGFPEDDDEEEVPSDD